MFHTSLSYVTCWLHKYILPLDAPLSYAADSEFVSIALLLTLTFRSLDTHLLVVLLQRRQVLTGLRELALFHTLAHVPVDERSLGVHKIELVVNAREDLRNRRRVADHTNCPHDLRQVAARHHGRRLVVDATLEASGRPVHELDRALGLNRGDSGVHVLRHHVAAVHDAARHVLAVPRVTLHHHARGLEDGIR